MKFWLGPIETTYEQLKLRVEIDDLRLYKFTYKDFEVLLLEEDGLKSDTYFRLLSQGIDSDLEHINIIQITISDGVRPRVYTQLRMAKELIDIEPDRAKDIVMDIALRRYKKAFES
jgi:hypothetical protein